MKTLSELSDNRDLHLINKDFEQAELYSKAVNYRNSFTDSDIATKRHNLHNLIWRHENTDRKLTDVNSLKKEMAIFDLILDK
jgi:hypothetical protein